VNDVILAEADALLALADTLDHNFERAASILWHCQGKVIVTGMGKAGLVGRKIAATFQSTGTPAVFLDPAAAAHGDMGLIGQGDTLLGLSNSGETDEIMHVAHFCQTRGNPTIAITSKPFSPLAGIADVALIMPDMPEGCPIGRAPMASCIIMMSLGDALAAELMVKRGFTETDFLALHHGGYLGRSIRAVA
jgi:arabinose-5-phosphate isomerase